MTKYPYRFLILVLVLGWIFDLLFWKQRVGGINFSLFVSAVLLGGIFMLQMNGMKPALKSLFLIAPIVFFGVVTFSRQEPLTMLLAYGFTLFALFTFAITYLGGRWMEYGFLDYLIRSMYFYVSLLVGPISFAGQVRTEQRERGQPARKLPIVPILRGLLIALPIVAVFTALLSSADLVFSKKLADFFKEFNAEKNTDYIMQGFIIIFWAYVVAGAFLFMATKSQEEKLSTDERWFRPFLGFTEATIVLGSVALLFLLFVSIQFQYFFGGNVNIGVTGFTYSQYARRGFNELLIVAFFSLVMMIGLNIFAKRENDFQRRIYSGLSIALVALVMVMLVSASQRLALATDWHGFSRLRLYPQVFLVWLGILFVGIVVLEVLRRERYLALAIILASVGFAVSLSFFNVDAAIVHHNVLRARQGKHFNASYLATLSTDAIPALADEFADTSLSQTIHEGIGAALLCHIRSPMIAYTIKDEWPSFNFSLWHARTSLDHVKGLLVDYRINKSNSFVRTPSNVAYACQDTEPNIRD